MNRDEMMSRILDRTEPWDMLIVGGGATGIGIAVDAASRGYDILLVEQSDYGKGTSSRSTKLIHGGVRYLQQGNITKNSAPWQCMAQMLRPSRTCCALTLCVRNSFIRPCLLFAAKSYGRPGSKRREPLTISWPGERGVFFLMRGRQWRQLPR